METHQEVRDWGKMHVYSTLHPQNAEQKQNVWSVKPSEHEHRNECASAALWSVFGVAAWHCHIELNLRELYPWSDQKRIHEPLLFCCRNRVLKKPMDGYQRRNSCMKSVCGESNRKSKEDRGITSHLLYSFLTCWKNYFLLSNYIHWFKREQCALYSYNLA